MPVFTKESLELLRQRIDLLEVMSPYVNFSRAGSSYKALCPFHEEKTPSFIIQRGDSHYHCYGCNAHGDAIHFLMSYQKMSFVDAVEYLSEKFSVRLELVYQDDTKTINKRRLKEVMELSARFYHFLLLHSQEAKPALEYLFERGIDLDFIKTFQLGFSSSNPYLFQKSMYEKKISKALLEEAGLVRLASTGKTRDFFSDRIMIPVYDSMGAVIGFSSRKYKEQTFGGKYINTPETPLFKKKRILFGLSLCRKQIAKERKAVIVEGQFDALRLIYEGFNYTVAAQGTAFGVEHVQELLSLGVNHVFLALDSDNAGYAAAEKIGDLFQKEAVEVSVLSLPDGSDPDKLLREKGPDGWKKILENSFDYLTFLVKKLSNVIDTKSPSGKNELVEILVKRVRAWKHPLMVHESLRKIAKLTNTPESVIGLPENIPTNLYFQKEKINEKEQINPDRVLEMDLLRWLLLMGETEKKLIEIAKNNLSPSDLKEKTCKRLFDLYFQAEKQNKAKDLLSLAIGLEESDEQIFLSELLQKKINREKAVESFVETVQKILDRNWMEKREEVKCKIHSGNCSNDDALLLVKEFDEIKKNRPKVQV